MATIVQLGTNFSAG